MYRIIVILSLFVLATLILSCVMPVAKDPQPRVASQVVGANGEMSARQSSKIIDKIADDAPDSGRLEQMVALLQKISEVPLYGDNRVELLIDGPETYGHMLSSIKAAQNYIMLEMYIFADDKTGQRFADALIESQRNGVQVFVIYDSFGSGNSDPKFFKAMEDQAIAIVEHNVINPLEGGNPLTFNNRDHRKILIVDGDVAYVGGLNLSNTHASISGARKTKNLLKGGWRDSHLAIYGPAVNGLQSIFRDNWNHPEVRLPPLSEQQKTNGKQGDQLIALLHSRGADSEISNIYIAYQEAMRRAKHRIWITQAYFAPNKEFMRTLINAGRRGIDVRLILPGVSDINIILDASRSRYGKLLKSGIRIYETQNSVMHAKTAVIDSVWSTVGTSNLDYRSFLHNDEVNAVVVGSEFADTMETQFIKDLESTSEITLEKWQQRSIGRRISEFFAWTVEYWL